MRAAGLKGFNVPKAYFVELDSDWTKNPDLITPSQKKRHSMFVQVYAKQIAQMWEMVAKREKNKGKVVPATAEKKCCGCNAAVNVTLLFAVAVLGLLFL